MLLGCIWAFTPNSVSKQGTNNKTTYNAGQCSQYREVIHVYIAIFCIMAPCSLVGSYRSFRDILPHTSCFEILDTI
jgi:hypothetical protein